MFVKELVYENIDKISDTKLPLLLLGLSSDLLSVFSRINSEIVCEGKSIALLCKLNGESVGCLRGEYDGDQFYIDTFVTINYDLGGDKLHDYGDLRREISSNLLGKVRIKNLGLTIFTNFIKYIRDRNLGVKYIDLVPAPTSNNFYLKIKDYLLTNGMINNFEEIRIKIVGHSDGLYYSYHIG